MSGNTGVTFIEPEEEIFAEKIDVRISGPRPGTVVSGSFTVSYRRLDADDFTAMLGRIREIALREKDGEDITADLVSFKRETLDQCIVAVEGIGDKNGLYSPEDQIAVVKSKIHYLNPVFQRFIAGHEEAPKGNSKPSLRR